MSVLSSWSSSVPAGPVALLSVREAGRAAVRRLSSLVGSSNSSPVTVRAVVRGVDRVSVVCSDDHIRVCRVSFASKALGCPLSVDAVFDKLSARVGKAVIFYAADGWSPDAWFVGCVGEELLGE